MTHNLGNDFYFFNTIADAGLTQVFPVSTGKIQFFSHSRAVPWHQPSWMTQSTKAECIPMAPLCTSVPTLRVTLLLPYFPFASASIQTDGGRGSTVHGRQETWPPPRPTSDILSWLRSLLCAGLPSAQKHRLPYTCMWAMWASQSHGSRLLTWAWGFASPFRHWA